MTAWDSAPARVITLEKVGGGGKLPRGERYTYSYKSKTADQARRSALNILKRVYDEDPLAWKDVSDG